MGNEIENKKEVQTQQSKQVSGNPLEDFLFKYRIENELEQKTYEQSIKCCVDCKNAVLTWSKRKCYRECLIEKVENINDGKLECIIDNYPE